MDGSNERIITRQHLITLLPDILLFFVGLIFLLEMQVLTNPPSFELKHLCEGAAIFFMSVGFLDVVKWWSFRVILTPTCVMVQQFWVFKRKYCQSDRGRKLAIHPEQNGWDEWLDKGTLVVYEPGSVVSTLDNLDNFSNISSMYQMMGG